MRDFYEYDPDLPLPYGYDHPAGVPKDNKEFVKVCNCYVEKTLKRRNKVKRNKEDLQQEIWTHLLGNNVLQKFLNGAVRRLPIEMTSMEACQFLGISWRTWVQFIQTHNLAKTVHPVIGRRTDFHAVWKTSSICEFDYEGVFRGKEIGKRVRPAVTSYGFKTYLQMSVRNAFANICRNKSRREKEQVLSPDTILSHQDNDSYRRLDASSGNNSSWESGIVAAMVDDEALVDLKDFFQRASIDPSTSTGIKTLNFLIHQGETSENGPQRNITLLGFLQRGYTLEESVRKMRQKLKIRVKTI